MSDPVTNVEIEDVLSSIRKLVSTDDRMSRNDAETDSERQGRDTGKLVLTPALRVDSEAPFADAPDAAGQADRDPQVEASVPDMRGPEQDDDASTPSGEGVTAVPVADDVFEAEEPSDEATGDEDAGEDETAAADPGSADAGSPPEDARPAAMRDDEAAAGDAVFTHRADQHAPTDPEECTAADWGERAAIFRRAAGTSDAAWEPDDVTEAAAADDLSGALPWLDVSTARDGEPPLGRTAGQAADQAHDADRAHDHDPLGPGPDAVEPDPSSRREAQGDNAFTAEDAFSSEEDTILDEDALRDLVAEIVRQELQGALGERITRNVRKLVRREIHRALAAQELD